MGVYIGHESSLEKHAYKIGHKNENFHWKKIDIFPQNIDCG